MEFSVDELNRFRQWFNALQDTDVKYLEPGDFELMKRISAALSK